MTFQLEQLARLEANRGSAERAAQLAGAARALRAASGTGLTASYGGDLRQEHVTRRDVVRDETTAAAWAQGQTMTRQQAVAYALEEGGV